MFCSVFFIILPPHHFFSFFFFNDTATTEIYTLSLHDALPISWGSTHLIPPLGADQQYPFKVPGGPLTEDDYIDRKSTRLNSSHQIISYAVFCLKKKKKNRHNNAKIYT